MKFQEGAESGTLYLVVFTVFLAAALLALIMGCGGSRSGVVDTRSAPTAGFAAIRDQYETVEQVQDALRKAGLESSQLMIGIDFTKSNTWTGAKSFGGVCLHTLSPDGLNPYQDAISILGRTLAAFVSALSVLG